MNRTANSVLGGCACLLVVACGGGGSGGGDGSSGGPVGDDIVGIDGTGIGSNAGVVAVGTVTGFGSVFVNGVRFDTSATDFVIDGVAGTQADLDVGDVVIVRGTLDEGSEDSGSATEIVFDDLVEGPVDAGSIDLMGATFAVLGQTVHVDLDTSFDDSLQPPSLSGLADSDIVEVSGFRRSDGSIQATRIELKPMGQPFELSGWVINHDAAALSFEINGLQIDYSASQIEGFPGGQVSDGDLVEVKGSTFAPSGEFVAASIEFKGNDDAGNDGDRFEIEGLITRFSDAEDFDVGGVSVATTSQTLFEGGNAADLGLNLKVEVEGDLNADGVLVARKVEIRLTTDLRVTATVDSVDTLNDSLVVLGITVNSDSVTRIEDKSDQEVEPFSIGDLNVGDYVEIRGSEFPMGSGEILARLLEREDAETDVELRGRVAVESGMTLEVLGVAVSTSAATEYRDENDQAISGAEFFDRIAIGTLISVTGNEISDRAIAAEELELED